MHTTTAGDNNKSYKLCLSLMLKTFNDKIWKRREGDNIGNKEGSSQLPRV